MKLPIVKTAIQVRFTDLDQLGHVSNSIYPQYLDMGRIDHYLAVQKEIELNKQSIKQPINVVASLKIDYLSEIKINHSVSVETWCEKIGNKSMTLRQDIFSDDKCAARATVIIVGIDPVTKVTVTYPREWEPSKSE